MKTLYALVGLPFSGKSTLLKNMAESTLIKTISFDTFWQDLEKDGDSNEKVNLSYESVTRLTEIEISAFLNSGFSVAYDSLNDTPDKGIDCQK